MSEQNTLFDLPKHILEPVQENNYRGKPRLRTAIRDQYEFMHSTLDKLISDDHQVRNVWNYVSQLDLLPMINKINSVPGNPGRSATDPKILLALWIYAIIEGIGSARLIERYASEHLAFKWICGGVSVNHHSISDFRKNNSEEFDQLISETIAILMKRNLVNLKRVSHDGMRVRASASSSSFRRERSLKECLVMAEKQVTTLRKEIDDDPGACVNRKQAAQKRAAEESKARIKEAMKELKKLKAEKEKAKKKHRKKLTDEEKKEIRASTTDPEARKMKMANGGFNPAYNMQIVVDTASRIIVGIEVTKRGNDYGEILPLSQQVKNRCGVMPKEWLADQGYLDFNDIEGLAKEGCKAYIPPKKVKNDVPRYGQSKEINEWRLRMNTDEAQEIYKERASTSEWVNAGMRNRGMTQLLVRGRKNVRGMLSLHALSHNMIVATKLGMKW